MYPACVQGRGNKLIGRRNLSPANGVDCYCFSLHYALGICMFKTSENVRRIKMKYQESAKGRKKHNEAQSRWKRKKKEQAIKYKGGKCSRCGYNTCIEALDFHHIDPTKKEVEVSHAIRNAWKWEKLKIELDKCILLCSNCHRELHFFDKGE